MRYKRIVTFMVLLFAICNFNVNAYERRPLHAAFIGEVEDTKMLKEDNLLILTVDGYIKGCQIEKGEILIVLNSETVILPDDCLKDGEEKEVQKVDPSTFKVKKDDTIFVVLGDQITTDSNPQVIARAIQVGK